MADDFASAFILASSSRVMREPGSLPARPEEKERKLIQNKNTRHSLT